MEKTDLDAVDSGEDLSQTLLYRELKNKAISLLARREYSAQELTTKLLDSSLGKAPAEHTQHDVFDKETALADKEKAQTDKENVVAAVIEALQASGYQSDLRFASMFVRYKAQSGNGPLKIVRELTFKGGNRSLFDQVIEEEHIDFFETALALMQRKFSIEQLKDYSTYQKAFRYLANRGFTTDQIKYARETLLEEQ